MKQLKLLKLLIGFLSTYGLLTWINSQTGSLLMSSLVALVFVIIYSWMIKPQTLKTIFNLRQPLHMFLFSMTIIVLCYTNLTVDKPLPFLVQPYNIQIIPNQEQQTNDAATKIEIAKVNINNEDQLLETLTLPTDWSYKETITTSIDTNSPLTLSNITNESVNVSFLKTSTAGSVTIYRNNLLLKTINLSSDTDQEVKVKVSSDHVFLLVPAYIGVFTAVYLMLTSLVSICIKNKNKGYKLCFNLKDKLNIQTEDVTATTIIYVSLPLLFISLFKFIGLANTGLRTILMGVFFVGIVSAELILHNRVISAKFTTLIKWIRTIFYLMMMSVLTILFMQVIYYFPNLDVTMTWVNHHINLIFLSSSIIFAISMLLFTLFNNLFLAISLSSLFMVVVSVANYYKMLVVGEPIYPSDTSMLSSMDDIIGYVKNILSPTLIIFLISIVGLIVVFTFIFRKGFKLKLKLRALYFVISAIYLVSIFYYDKSPLKPLVDSTVYFTKWNQLNNYGQNGFLFGFITNLQNDLMIKNDAYTESTMNEMIDYYTKKAQAYNEQTTLENQPNIVTVVSESLSDPTVFDQLTFSEDPIPNLRQYLETYSSGHFLSPFKGNRTANVEFEYLMGFTNSLLLEGTIPFQQALSTKENMPSFISYFDNLGYSSVAIHPNNAAFYKRNLVYPTLGFDEFLSIDKMNHLEYIDSQKYVNDESVFNELYAQIENSESPVFAYGLTMANHIAIFDQKFGENTISVTDANGEHNTEMETYAEGLKQTDLALKDFITKIENDDEPTVVVFFGDHLINFQSPIHEQHGYIEKDTDAARSKMFYETPLLIMSNMEDFHIDHIDDLSPIFIAPLILRELNLPLSPFYVFLLDVYDEFSVLHNNFKLDANGQQVHDLNDQQKDLLLTLELIQYDILEGKEYSLSNFFTIPQQ